MSMWYPTSRFGDGLPVREKSETLNRHDWEEQVVSSNMNTTARAIALVLGRFGNWKACKTVEPGISTLAKHSGADESTVKKYLAAMVDQGWLVPAGTGKYNTTIYELAEVFEPVKGILAQKKRKMNPNSTKALRKGPLVPDTRSSSSRYQSTKFPVPPGLVPDTTDKNQEEPELQPEKQPAKVADAPHPVNGAERVALEVEEVSKLEITDHSPNLVGHGTWRKPKRKTTEEEFDEIFEGIA